MVHLASTTMTKNVSSLDINTISERKYKVVKCSLKQTFISDNEML